MSIINDALKKAQQNLEHQKKSDKSDPLNPTPVRDKKISDLAEAVIIASFLGSLIILSTFYIFSPKDKDVKGSLPTVNAQTPESPAKNDLPPVEPTAQTTMPISLKTSQTKTRAPGGLTLTGIVKMGEGYVALINNKMVKPGDNLGEKKVLRISEDEVKILDRGEILILKLGGI